MKKLIVFAALALLVTGCGVKNDLVKPSSQTNSQTSSQTNTQPNSKPNSKEQPDPSKPPYPLGR
ncbi:MAG TPA: hypothetical protein VEM35_03965 [Rhizomicrobium sp.]|nr:hypothetical protein [Rhizomicrobium sp.]